ncbi:MAG TPA: hypothetical protein VFC47_13985, partial [Caulobacteraceae bacterium]|nr:hypothetical protein [Caulobacteraceae bacterium]
MTYTSFSSSEPVAGIEPSEAPMVVGNPALMRRETRPGRPAWMIAAPVAILALAAVGGIVAATHHRAQPVVQQVADASPAQPAIAAAPLSPA